MVTAAALGSHRRYEYAARKLRSEEVWSRRAREMSTCQVLLLRGRRAPLATREVVVLAFSMRPNMLCACRRRQSEGITRITHARRLARTLFCGVMMKAVLRGNKREGGDRAH